MRPTGKCDRVKLHDILILIITGIADSPGRVRRDVVVVGGGKDTGVKWARFMTTPANYCNDY